MKCPMDQNPSAVETLAAAIARSPIVVLPPATLLPAGFEEVDVAILNWLAAEARRMRPQLCADVMGAACASERAQHGSACLRLAAP